jgi:hypothetical protein
MWLPHHHICSQPITQHCILILKNFIRTTNQSPVRLSLAPEKRQSGAICTSVAWLWGAWTGATCMAWLGTGANHAQNARLPAALVGMHWHSLDHQFPLITICDRTVPPLDLTILDQHGQGRRRLLLSHRAPPCRGNLHLQRLRGTAVGCADDRPRRRRGKERPAA